MMIRVMYSDGRFDLVKQMMLDLLLAKDRIASFRRSSGWAVVGRDPIRGVGGISFQGQDRRLTC